MPMPSPGFTPLGTVTIRKEEDVVDDSLAATAEEGGVRILLSLLHIVKAGRDIFGGVDGAADAECGADLMTSVDAIDVVVVAAVIAAFLQQMGQNQSSDRKLMSTLTHSAW